MPRMVRVGVQTLVALLLIAGAGYLWVKVPDIYPIPQADAEVAIRAAQEAARWQAIETTRASVLAALAGVGALVTIAINYRNSGTSIETLAVSSRTFEIQARAHFTDRYAKGIEQLGDGALAVRLGGVYALEQFAVDSGTDSDQRTVVEVLSAFIRTAGQKLGDGVAEGVSAELGSGVVESPCPSNAIDVAAALSVLGRLPFRPKVPRADFAGANLAGANLTLGDFRSVNFTGADLSRSILVGANLRGALLGGARCHGADCRHALLSRARLDRSEFIGAQLDGAQLVEAYLVSANFERARFTGANLEGAKLIQANVKNGNLAEANLTRATLQIADLSNVNMFGADLKDAYLAGTDLTGAVLIHVKNLADDQLTDEQKSQVAALDEP